MATPFQKTALDTVKRFRARELTGLMGQLRIFGPLPEPPASSTRKAGAPLIVLPNPFIPRKNPKTGKWRPPKYSLRRQAELVKAAQATGTLKSLPPGPKKFAAELRMERVKASLPTADLQLLNKTPESALKAKVGKPYTQVVKELEAEFSTINEELTQEKKKLEAATAEYDIGELATFEAEAGEGKEGAAKLAEHRAAQRLRAATKEAHEKRCEELSGAYHAKSRLSIALQDKARTKRMKQKKALNWNTQVVWSGEPTQKKVPGSELGTRLYSGKKRMFKGHLWERKRARRIRRHTILMRDMPARIARYKDYYKKRRPNPLKPSRYTKAPKLPF